MAWNRPPWLRKTPMPFMRPSEQKRPMGPFIDPSMWWITPLSSRGINGSWQGNRAEGASTRSRQPMSARSSNRGTTVKSPLRKWWWMPMVMPLRTPHFSRAVRRSATRLSLP